MVAAEVLTDEAVLVYPANQMTSAPVLLFEERERRARAV